MIDILNDDMEKVVDKLDRINVRLKKTVERVSGDGLGLGLELALGLGLGLGLGYRAGARVRVRTRAGVSSGSPSGGIVVL